MWRPRPQIHNKSTTNLNVRLNHNNNSSLLDLKNAAAFRCWQDCENINKSVSEQQQSKERFDDGNGTERKRSSVTDNIFKCDLPSQKKEVVTSGQTPSDLISTTSSAAAAIIDNDAIEVHSSAVHASIRNLHTAETGTCDFYEFWIQGRLIDALYEEPRDQDWTNFNESNLLVSVTGATSAIVSINGGPGVIHVPTHLVRRAPTTEEAASTFVLRVGLIVEVSFNGTLTTSWRTGRIVYLHGDCVEINIKGSSQTLLVDVSRIRQVPSPPRTLLEHGGLIQEVVSYSDSLLGISEAAMTEIRRKTGLLQAKIHDSTFIIYAGLPSAIARAKLMTQDLVKTLKSSMQFQERRERRLRLLAERREAYNGNRVLEFSVEIAYIGLVIGRQGEKLGRIAREYQVEIRIFPDDRGSRLVRLYGPETSALKGARDELEVLYQEMYLNPGTSSIEQHAIKNLANTSGLFSTWVDSEQRKLIVCGTRRAIRIFIQLYRVTLKEAAISNHAAAAAASLSSSNLLYQTLSTTTRNDCIPSERRKYFADSESNDFTYHKMKNCVDQAQNYYIYYLSSNMGGITTPLILSDLELDRCQILPPLPRCFDIDRNHFSSGHLNAIMMSRKSEHDDIKICSKYTPTNESLSLAFTQVENTQKKSSLLAYSGTNDIVSNSTHFGDAECATRHLLNNNEEFSAIAKQNTVKITCNLSNHTSTESYESLMSQGKETTTSSRYCNDLGRYRNLKIAVLVGGERTSSGLHNVTIGVLSFLKKFCAPDTDGSYTLYGFPDGPMGLLRGEITLLGDKGVAMNIFLNRGGCEALAYRSLRSLTRDNSQLKKATDVITRLQLDGLIIYADREDVLAVSLLAAALAETGVSVIAVPHGVRGDFALPEYLPISLGFDTARRTIAELTGNIATDSVSSKKYYHFISTGSSLMTLETALMTRPSLSILSEEVYHSNIRLQDIIDSITETITKRFLQFGKRSGTILISDRVVESLREIHVLLEELTSFFNLTASPPNETDLSFLSDDSRKIYLMLPPSTRQTLMTQRDTKGCPQLPSIQTEVLIAHLVDRELKNRGVFVGPAIDVDFLYRTHNLGDEGYCAMPTDFDCGLGFSLGHVAAALVANGNNGYAACLKDLQKPVSEWTPYGVPLVNFLTVWAKETMKVCVPRRSIDFESVAFKCYKKYRETWQASCLYRSPGPVQFLKCKIDVQKRNFPLYFQAQFIDSENFSNIVQKPDEAEKVLKLEALSDSYLAFPPIKDTFKLPMTRKIPEQLASLQRVRLNYSPRLPSIFHKKFTVEFSDVTARLAKRPALLRAVFPLTHNLRALEIVTVGLRLSDSGMWNQMISVEKQHMSTKKNEDDEIQIPRSRSSVALCGFVGSRSVVKMPVTKLGFGLKRSSPSNLLPIVPLLHDSCNDLGKESCSQNNGSDSFTNKVSDGFQNQGIATLQNKRCESLQRIRSELQLKSSTDKITTCPYTIHLKQKNLLSNDDTIQSPKYLSQHSVMTKPSSIQTFNEVNQPGMFLRPQSLDKLMSQRTELRTFPTDILVKGNFPYHKISIIFCFLGRPAPGAMNILWGLTDYVSRLEDGVVYGAVGGLEGLINSRLLEVTQDTLSLYKNQGGIEMLSRTREQCGAESELAACLNTCVSHDISGLILAGGSGTICTAALLSEHFLQSGTKTAVNAVPVSINAGLPSIEVTLGHDTTTRVFSSVIGSIMVEARSSKSWYLIRVSGRDCSHLCVECALETQPTLVLISEEVEEKKMSLMEITNFIADVVEARVEKGMIYGVVLLSDSLLHHIPEVRMLFNEINVVFQSENALDDNHGHRRIPRTEDGLSMLRSCLTPWGSALFSSLPTKIQWQFAFSKDFTQNVDLANVDTEILLKTMVQNELTRRKSIGAFRQKGAAFNCKTHFLAYQGRSALPTNFDCDLGFALGYCAAALVDGGQTGYLGTISKLHLPVENWSPEAIPLTAMIDVKPAAPNCQDTTNTTKNSPLDTLKLSLHVPALRCSLFSAPYKLIQEKRLSWLLSDRFRNPGPVQFEPDKNELKPETRLHVLRLSPEANPLNPTTQLKEISRLCAEIKLLCGQYAFSKVTATTVTSLGAMVQVLRTLTSPGLVANHDENTNDQINYVLEKDITGRPFLELFLAQSVTYLAKQ